jgi:Tyrosine phosphatase family
VSVCPIDNFAKVDDVLWRGARPTVAGVRWLIGNGVKTVINLEMVHDDASAIAAAHATITYLRLRDWEPLAAGGPPLEDHHIRDVLAAIRRSPKLVFIHCRDGQNRTGLAVAAYRLIDKDEPVDAVLADMASFHGFWEKVDAAYIRSLDIRRAEFAAGT